MPSRATGISVNRTSDSGFVTLVLYRNPLPGRSGRTRHFDLSHPCDNSRTVAHSETIPPPCGSSSDVRRSIVRVVGVSETEVNRLPEMFLIPEQLVHPNLRWCIAALCSPPFSPHHGPIAQCGLPPSPTCPPAGSGNAALLVLRNLAASAGNSPWARLHRPLLSGAVLRGPAHGRERLARRAHHPGHPAEARRPVSRHSIAYRTGSRVEGIAGEACPARNQICRKNGS